MRRQHGDLHAFCRSDIFCHLIYAAEKAVNHRRHKLNGIIELQISSSVGYNSITCSMGFIERIGRKVHHFIEDLVCNVCGHTVAHSARNLNNAFFHDAVDKILPFLEHNVVLFLCHCTADKVASPHGIPCYIAHDAHYLLLVNHAAIGGL